MTRIFPSLTRLALFALAVVGAGCRDQSQVLAMVLAVKGGVTQVGPKTAELSAGAAIASPATIRTATNSAIVISALPGVMFRLEAAGELTLERLELRKRADEMTSRTARLQLRRGRGLIWVDEFRRGSIDLELRTPAGSLDFSGPAFAEIALGAGGETRVICISGALSVAGTTLSAGQWANVPPGSSQPVSQLAADTEEVWQALLQAREIEPQLLDLQARQRETTPIRGLDPAGNAPKK